MGFYPQSTPALLEQPARIRSGNLQNGDFIIIFLIFFFFLSQTTYSLTGRNVHHKSHTNPFQFPCTGPFRKISAGYEATSTNLAALRKATMLYTISNKTIWYMARTHIYIYTSLKMNEWQCSLLLGIYHAKNSGNKKFP